MPWISRRTLAISETKSDGKIPVGYGLYCRAGSWADTVPEDRSRAPATAAQIANMPSNFAFFIASSFSELSLRSFRCDWVYTHFVNYLPLLLRAIGFAA